METVDERISAALSCSIQKQLPCNFRRTVPILGGPVPVTISVPAQAAPSHCRRGCGPARGRSLSITLCSLKSLPREDVHKVDIMTFCQQKAAQSRKSETPGGRDSALLWQLLVLLCRQNGVSITAAGGWAGAGWTEI